MPTVIVRTAQKVARKRDGAFGIVAFDCGEGCFYVDFGGTVMLARSEDFEPKGTIEVSANLEKCQKCIFLNGGCARFMGPASLAVRRAPGKEKTIPDKPYPACKGEKEKRKASKKDLLEGVKVVHKDHPDRIGVVVQDVSGICDGDQALILFAQRPPKGGLRFAPPSPSVVDIRYLFLA